MVSLAYQILHREIKKAGSVGAVAKKLGYARSSISLYYNGNYTADVEQIEKKIIGVFTNKILCPYTNQIIDKSECDEVESQSLNTSNPVLFKLQQYCKSCPVKNNPKEKFINHFNEKNND